MLKLHNVRADHKLLISFQDGADALASRAVFRVTGDLCVHLPIKSIRLHHTTSRFESSTQIIRTCHGHPMSPALAPSGLPLPASTVIL